MDIQKTAASVPIWHVATSGDKIVCVGQSEAHCRRVAAAIGADFDEIRRATTPVVKGAVRGRDGSEFFRIRADGSVAPSGKKIQEQQG